MLEAVSSIQKRNKLNQVFRCGEEGPGGAYHNYHIKSKEGSLLQQIQFQEGRRGDDESIEGVVMVDLLEIVRDQIMCYQKGPYTTRENAMALTHVEGALLWLNKRSDDRYERGVLGSYEK